MVESCRPIWVFPCEHFAPGQVHTSANANLRDDTFDTRSQHCIGDEESLAKSHRRQEPTVRAPPRDAPGCEGVTLALLYGTKASLTLLMPMRPALPPTTSSTKSGEVAVSPKRVVLRYLASVAHQEASGARRHLGRTARGPRDRRTTQSSHSLPRSPPS